MILFNLIRLSIRNFRTMKLRSVLTVLGIGIGIGAILFLVALGQGLQKLLIERITTAEALLTLDVLPPSSGPIKIDNESLEKIRQMAAVEEVSPVKIEKAKVSFEGVTAGVSASFVQDNFFRLAGLDSLFSVPLQQGSEKEEDVVFADNQSIVVSQAVLQLLSFKEEAVGKEVSVYVRGEGEQAVVEGKFRIVNIITDEANSIVYLPIDAYSADQLKGYNNLKVQVASTVLLEQVREKLVGSGFLVSALSDTVRQANQVFTIMKIILAVFGAIALTVAAIGMFNTMTIALLERTQEIGIMRAIGASRRDIWHMFLIEAFLIGFLGGVSGVLIGVSVAELANGGLNLLARHLGGEPIDIFNYPLWFIFGVVIFSTTVAVLTGFYPARRAAHLNPLDALRYK